MFPVNIKNKLLWEVNNNWFWVIIFVSYDHYYCYIVSVCNLMLCVNYIIIIRYKFMERVSLNTSKYNMSSRICDFFDSLIRIVLFFYYSIIAMKYVVIHCLSRSLFNKSTYYTNVIELHNVMQLFLWLLNVYCRSCWKTNYFLYVL